MAVRIYTINVKPAISKHNKPTNSKCCTNKMFLLDLRQELGLMDVHSNTIIQYASLILKVGYKGYRLLFLFLLITMTSLNSYLSWASEARLNTSQLYSDRIMSATSGKFNKSNQIYFVPKKCTI